MVDHNQGWEKRQRGSPCHGGKLALRWRRAAPSGAPGGDVNVCAGRERLISFKLDHHALLIEGVCFNITVDLVQGVC